MFQSFEVTSYPERGPARLEALRAQLRREGVDGFLVPRADLHQGEYVAPRDERLAWLTGFTGSAGFCAVLLDQAGVFIDGRYRVAVKSQVDLDVFTPVPWPDVKLADWLREAWPKGGKLAYDPWLHTKGEITRLSTGLEGSGIALCETDNFVDRVWEDQPDPPMGKIMAYPQHFAGRSDEDKRRWLCGILNQAEQQALVLTLPDSIAWLLNIRGSDIDRIPVVQACAILQSDGRMDLFTDPSKASDIALDPMVTLRSMDQFAPALAALVGPVRVDETTAPLAVTRHLERGGVPIIYNADPCILEKAQKTDAEIAGARAAHLRDGAAMVHFLAWLDDRAPKGGLTEIDVVTALEGFRRQSSALRDISFETICGAGPHGAIMHYRVSQQSNRTLGHGELLVVDSGGQYLDGTTDITRTIALGPPPAEARDAFTRVLQGMIAISRARFPKGVSGRDLDPLARAPLWMAGQDFNHGTGHGVGAYLSVHEGPQRISRVSEVPLCPGMILSNEPGYYREGEFGIRIENLIVVREAPVLAAGDDLAMYDFETLTYVPIDRRLIVAAMLSPGERAWLDQYHADVARLIGPLVKPGARIWLESATAPLG